MLLVKIIVVFRKQNHTDSSDEYFVGKLPTFAMMVIYAWNLIHHKCVRYGFLALDAGSYLNTTPRWKLHSPTKSTTVSMRNASASWTTPGSMSATFTSGASFVGTLSWRMERPSLSWYKTRFQESYHAYVEDTLYSETSHRQLNLWCVLVRM